MKLSIEKANQAVKWLKYQLGGEVIHEWQYECVDLFNLDGIIFDVECMVSDVRDLNEYRLFHTEYHLSWQDNMRVCKSYPHLKNSIKMILHDIKERTLEAQASNN